MALKHYVTLTFAMLVFSFLHAQHKEKLPQFQKHYVKDRETPSSIAHDFNIKTKDFLMLNNFPDDVKLKPGQVVLIRQLKEGETVQNENAYQPTGTDNAADNAVTEKKTTKPPPVAKKENTDAPARPKPAPPGPNGTQYELSSGGFHVVQKGQTFYHIALIYGLKVDELKKLNNMTTTDIKVGQELRISK